MLHAISDVGRLTKFFDRTLAADAASIDTGASGIGAGCDVLEVFILARTAVVAVSSSIVITVNNDSGANYDRCQIVNVNTTMTGSNVLAQTSWTLAVFGASALANAATAIHIVIPAYAQTTFFKQGYASGAQVEDTAADARVYTNSLGYRSTSAITRMAIAGNGGDLVAGTRLLVYGR